MQIRVESSSNKGPKDLASRKPSLKKVSSVYASEVQVSALLIIILFLTRYVDHVKLLYLLRNAISKVSYTWPMMKFVSVYSNAASSHMQGQILKAPRPVVPTVAGTESLSEVTIGVFGLAVK